MCYFTLRFMNQLLHCSATHCRVIMGSILGGVMSSIIMIMPVGNVFLKIGVFHIGLWTFLMYKVFRIKKIHILLQGVASFLGIMLLAKGFINCCFLYVPYLRECKIEIGAVLLCAWVFYRSASYLVGKRQEGATKICEITLQQGEKIIYIKGLIDTGNSLVDPISGKPVSILEKELASFLQLETITKGYCVIPYHAINEARGILEGCTIDLVTIIHNGIERIQKDVIIASAPNGASASKEYQMIVHPQLLEE